MSEVQKKITVDGSNDGKWLDLVSQQVGSLRYGVVEIIVQDSQVTQIEKTERLRLDKPSTESKAGR